MSFMKISVRKISRKKSPVPLSPSRWPPIMAVIFCAPMMWSRFDNPVNPTKFEKLIEVTGAKSVDWPLRLQCCGDPLNGKNDTLARELGEKKMKSAEQAGADLICVGCTHCQMQFDKIGTAILDQDKAETVLPALLYPQLLGLSLGLEAKVLGIDQSRLNIADLLEGF